MRGGRPDVDEEAIFVRSYSIAAAVKIHQKLNDFFGAGRGIGGRESDRPRLLAIRCTPHLGAELMVICGFGIFFLFEASPSSLALSPKGRGDQIRGEFNCYFSAPEHRGVFE